MEAATENSQGENCVRDCIVYAVKLKCEYQNQPPQMEGHAHHHLAVTKNARTVGLV